MRVAVKDIFTIPNILSYIRIVLIPLFAYFYITAVEPRDYYIAALIILFSGLTDLLDGFIARKFNQITELGKIIDPIADKLTQMAIIVCLLFQYEYVWILIVLFVVKELFMGINGLVLLRRGKRLDGSMWFGKVSTAVFYVATFLLIAFPEMNSSTAAVLMTVTGAFLALSFVLYIPVFWRMHRNA
ncbi:CDP-alcohol phosphatidyltransferase family protein [Virgibacillus sp. YIM 98842]|uniref:CDP-alcohol phosphatidyltransferase family protein n=1 Tax=Virgibacillus sp. YIM 98842 TaxID=2663533 RepID=UPI0013DBB3BE|nr:CDP-alcohol phosphatidyltransferase family protein [Virgibacillus sp. YIM 98842]